MFGVFRAVEVEFFWHNSFDPEKSFCYCIENLVVDVNIGDMSFSEKDNYADFKNGDGHDGLLPGDLAMKSFVPVKKRAGEVESYVVKMKCKAQFNHVPELVATSLRFCQDYKGVKSDRKKFKAASKLWAVTPDYVDTLVRKLVAATDKMTLKACERKRRTTRRPLKVNDGAVTDV